MGSPVSTVLANMVMEDVEQKAVDISQVKPLFWKRYVDDVISAERLPSQLNSVLEREKDKYLPFLKLEVCRAEQDNLKASACSVNRHTLINTSLSTLATLFAIKKSLAKNSLKRTDCLPSSLNSKAEGR